VRDIFLPQKKQKYPKNQDWIFLLKNQNFFWENFQTCADWKVIYRS